MRSLKLRAIGIAALGMLMSLTFHARTQGSDHADTAENVNRLGADLTDVFIFPSATNANNVVLAMNVRGLIPSGQAANFSFDPQVLYQFKIDTSGDHVEDLVIQAVFVGTGPNQIVRIAGPIAPPFIGTSSIFGRRQPTTGVINRTFSPTAGMTVYAGAREDPFFFDLEQFYTIFPDRMTPLTGNAVDYPSPNAPHKLTWRPPGAAQDFLIGFNVLSIVVELPRALLADPTSGQVGVIGVWCTTSIATGPAGGFKYTQQDRLARPVVNEVLATVSNSRHMVNNHNNPTDDINQLANDIHSFLTFPAGRSMTIQNVLVSVLVPDVMQADLTQTGEAAYLGLETGGATSPVQHSTFGGRKLTDDVVDISLGAVFGNIIPAVTGVPDDGSEIPALTTDNVGPGGKHFLATFPYLGAPQ